VVTAVTAAACDRAGARTRGQVHLSLRQIAALVQEELGLPTLALSTVWDLLDRAAIKPWHYRSWIFPRDPEFTERANTVLDLYQRQYQGKPLGPGDFVFSGDEKPGLLLRSRCHPTQPPTPGQVGRQEFEYRRHGTAVLLALLDVGSGQVFHETVARNGSDPFRNLLTSVVQQAPYREAERLFFVVDNGGSHSRQRFQSRLNEWFPRSEFPELVAVHLPKHASWLNQIELFFSILGRRALPHFECRDRPTMVEHVKRFIDRYNEDAQPFHWRFTKEALAERMERWPTPMRI
jgi:hypothetical protein